MPKPRAAATKANPNCRDFTDISLKCIWVSTALDQMVTYICCFSASVSGIGVAPSAAWLIRQNIRP